MTIQSLDDVLAGVDASEQEIDNELPETEVEASQESETEAEPEGGDQERDAQGALHAERNRVRRKYTDTVADFERKFTEATSSFDKKLAESLTANDQKWEQRFNQFASQIQPRHEPKPEVVETVPDIFEDANGFVQHGVNKAIDPIKSEFAQFREHVSRRDAIRDHGAEKVQAAFAALDQAAKSGNRDAIEQVSRVKSSMDPFGDIVEWHAKSSVISEVGKDPAAFIQKKLDEALNDPAFLAKAAEKLGVKPGAAAKPNATQALPSLNRVTAAADEDGGEDDAREVFNTALRSGVRR